MYLGRPHRVGGNPVSACFSFSLSQHCFASRFLPALGKRSKRAALAQSHRALGIATPIILSPGLQGSPPGVGRGVFLHGLSPIFLIKQLGENASAFLLACRINQHKLIDQGCGYLASGKDDCVLPAGSSLACLSMLMHSLGFKNASF